MPAEPVDLFNLARGAVSERFEQALQDVLLNILDPNHPAEKKREIHIKLVFHPDDKRQTAGVDIEVITKPQPRMAVSTLLFIGKTQGRCVAFENDPRQMELDLDNVATIKPVPDAK